MTTKKISSGAQALVTRLARMDPANPRQDKAAIERAITAHLAALGLPERPFTWAKDAGTGSLSIIERGAFAVTVTSTPTRDAVRDVSWATARKAVRRAARKAAEGADDRVWEAVWPAWRGAWRAARINIWIDVTFAVTEAAWDHAVRLTVWDDAFDVEWRHLPLAGRPDDDATYKAIAGNVAWKAILVAPMTAFDHPAVAKFLGVEHPMLDAFEAGLSLLDHSARRGLCASALARDRERPPASCRWSRHRLAFG